MHSDRFIYFEANLAGIPVLFLHAFPVDHRMWHAQMAFLKSNGISSLAVDYPGFGRTPPPTGARTIEDYADIAMKTAGELGIGRAIVVGLSMGGYVAMAMLRRNPAFVHALVLAATRAGADSPAGLERRRKLIEAVRAAGSSSPVIEGHLEKFFTLETRRQSLERVAFVRTMMEDAHPEGIIRALEAMGGRPDSFGDLQSFNRPALVITGRTDELIPPDEGERMAKALPQGRHAVIDHAAHLVNLEQPDRFNRLLLEFIQSVGQEG